jgi:hypothetical protein
MTGNELARLARDIEAHLSPAFQAQLLEADLALGNALRELVELERAKFNASHLASMQIGQSGTALKVRTTAYPERRARPNCQVAFSAAFRLGATNFVLRAWIAEDNKFINIELASV